MSLKGLMTTGNGEKPSSPADLTPRESQVLVLLASGLTAREASERLGIAARTVEHYREKLKLKLRVLRTAGLISYAVRHGMVQSED